MDENNRQPNEQQKSTNIKVLKIEPPTMIEREASGGEDFYGYGGDGDGDGDMGGDASSSSSSSSIGALNDPFIRTLIKPVDGGRGARKSDSDKGNAERAESVKDDACSECSSTHMSDELVLKGCMYTILNRFLSADTDKHGPQTVAMSLDRIATALEAIQRSLEHDKETNIHHAR